MPYFLVSVTANFPNGGSSESFMDVFDAENEDQAAIDGIKACANSEGDDLVWRSSRSAEHVFGDVFYSIANIQYLSPRNGPIFKTYLENAFPKRRK